jgi:uncharacterized protein YcbK (DUF882 family)
VANWEFFTEDELRCKGTGECNMDEAFMEALIRLRKDYNKPMIISSGYRDMSYNTVIGGSPNSAHLHGKAVDVVIGGHEAYKLLRLAIVHGFKGIGVSQRGMFERRFLHIDMMEDSDKTPRPWIWSYK